ncbi:MAG: dehydrogenase [Alphaproteobacteria bacterium 64-11]|nr:Ldh family oxidoreductase [Alphaproteobacteria bacterium]OJU11849.1 MAG: dehydrogenase [Alphaproteobacteria bacterium 64-11]
MLVPVDKLRALAEGILTGNGVPPEHAKIQAGLFIDAEMRGIPSHGLLRLRRVIERIQAGLSVPGATGAQVWSSRNFLSVDGMHGLGPVVVQSALDAIVPRAREDGIAIAAIRNCNHLGALAYYAEQVAEQGLTIIGLTISEALVHPWGGRKAMIGTNPIAIGVPADPHPMVLDMATGLVSMGKIHDHANRGAPIPSGWALDENGDPTTDAVAAKKGAIAPFGGPKGYALGLAFEVLVASLALSGIGTHVKGTLDSVEVSNKGDLFIVIAPQHAAAAKAIVTAYLDDIRNAAPADPAQPVVVPGDRARATREKSQEIGVYLDDGLWDDLTKLAAESRKGN